jgi:formylglycine-generating enzyme required for sulfatase activity
MRWVVRILAAAFVLAAGMGQAQAPQTRVALVIANGAYESVPALTNPARDGDLIAGALRRAGFDVGALQRDLTKAQFEAALRDFKRKADAADIALIYYAGHGIELEEQNWLLPVDARIADPADAHVEGVSLATVLRFVQGARRARIVVLDACRNNPFALRLVSPTRSLTRGLRPVEGLPAGTVVAYSASFGQEAAEGVGEANSPFAAALARRLVEPGLEVRFLFANVRDDVIAANASSPTAAIRNQRPWFGAELSAEQIFFVPPVTPVSAPVDRSELPPPPAPKTRPGETFKECDVCPEMVVAPAGRFLMGSPESEAERGANEGPQREVTIARPFAVGRFEVTFAQWDACVAAGGCAPPEEGPYSPLDEGWGRDTRPVINVSWQDAKRYVRWLNGRIGGKAYRLLSEAEWEYAARAGTTTAFSTGATIAPTQAQYAHRQAYAGSPVLAANPGRTAPVGSFPANAFKLHDMHGNVWEWVEDCFAASYARAPTDGSALVNQSCSERVIRGGSWYVIPRVLRSANRSGNIPTSRYYGIGFRVARTL